MNGIASNGYFYGAQATDDSESAWQAIKVGQDGNPVILDGPFATIEEAEECAGQAFADDMAANGQFGVGA